CLIGNACKATAREKLSEEIGPPDCRRNDRTVDELVGRLRIRLNDQKVPKRIVPVLVYRRYAIYFVLGYLR
ncbi:helix-turn-helix domain-containing protein, partial [Pseudoalteromonas sp. S1688]|uniref:helix-turn-helix domain-containing protein n=1 Tax=Pseudoalteromonas sp. S1688 TaxID=579511 RepID=UPI00110A0F28